jgi:hypothetical protein
MAATLRRETARPARSYLTGLATPFVLMLAGSLAGRWMFGDAAAGHGIVQQLLLLAGSVAAGVVAGASYFACYFRQQLSGYYVILRGRLAVLA